MTFITTPTGYNLSVLLAHEWLSKCGKSMQWNTTQPQIHSTIWVNLKIISLEKKQKRVHIIGPYSYKTLQNAIWLLLGQRAEPPYPSISPAFLGGFPREGGGTLGNVRLLSQGNSQRTIGHKLWAADVTSTREKQLLRNTHFCRALCCVGRTALQTSLSRHFCLIHVPIKNAWRSREPRLNRECTFKIMFLDSFIHFSQNYIKV